MNAYVLVRLVDMTDPDNTFRHTIHLEVRCFVQVILLPEDVKYLMNEWLVGVSPLDGIAGQYFPGPSLAGTDESS